MHVAAMAFFVCVRIRQNTLEIQSSGRGIEFDKVIPGKLGLKLGATNNRRTHTENAQKNVMFSWGRHKADHRPQATRLTTSTQKNEENHLMSR
jgi:hypothetical protein